MHIYIHIHTHIYIHTIKWHRRLKKQIIKKNLIHAKNLGIALSVSQSKVQDDY